MGTPDFKTNYKCTVPLCDCNTTMIRVCETPRQARRRLLAETRPKMFRVDPVKVLLVIGVLLLLAAPWVAGLVFLLLNLD